MLSQSSHSHSSLFPAHSHSQLIPSPFPAHSQSVPSSFSAHSQPIPSHSQLIPSSFPANSKPFRAHSQPISSPFPDHSQTKWQAVPQNVSTGIERDPRCCRNLRKLAQEGSYTHTLEDDFMCCQISTNKLTQFHVHDCIKLVLLKSTDVVISILEKLKNTNISR